MGDSSDEDHVQIIVRKKKKAVAEFRETAATSKPGRKQQHIMSDSSDDMKDRMVSKDKQKEYFREEGSQDEVEESELKTEEKAESLVLDFDKMMERKRKENRRHRKRSGIDVINYNDDAIANLIADMRHAAREDRELNAKGMPATKKISMLPMVASELSKVNLILPFLDANILSVIREWLTPLADRSLPHLHIRAKFLKYLWSIPIDDCGRLKESGIGKAVMYLVGHPKETRENRDLARKLISKWSRPIFRLNADFTSMSKDERQRRDREMAEKLKEVRNSRKGASDGRKTQECFGKPTEPSALRPGDSGWIPRARVPMVDNKEYILRPEWQSKANLDGSSHSNKKSGQSLLEKHKRKQMERRRANKYCSSSKLSLEGKRLYM